MKFDEKHVRKRKKINRTLDLAGVDELFDGFADFAFVTVIVGAVDHAVARADGRLFNYKMKIATKNHSNACKVTKYVQISIENSKN